MANKNYIPGSQPRANGQGSQPRANGFEGHNYTFITYPTPRKVCKSLVEKFLSIFFRR